MEINFYSLSIALIFFLLQFIGLLPFRFSTTSVYFKPSRLCLAYHSFMFLTYLVLVSNEIHLRISWFVPDISPDAIVTLLTTLAACVAGVGIFMTMCINRRLMLKVFQATLVLSKERVQRTFWRRLFFSNLLTLCFTVISFVVTERYASEHNLPVTGQIVTSILFYPILQTIINAFIMLSASLIQILTAVLKITNDQLQINSSASEFDMLLSRHQTVISLFKKINRIFGPAWLILFLYNAIGLLFMAYYSITLVTIKPDDYCWIYSYVWSSVNLISAATSAASEAKRTGNIIFSKLYDCNDPESENAEAFCILQLHEAVQFDASNFFNLDWTIVIAVMGAVSTYTLIFIQFRLSDSG